MTARRSLVSSSGSLRWSAQWKISPSVDSCVSLRSRTLLSRIGPNWVSVARIGVALLLPPRERNSTGYAVGVQSSPVSFTRVWTRALSSPGRAIPDRSPLTSARNTGTPASDSCPASACSVFVLPVPVAPATRPCRLSIASGIRTRAVRIDLPVDDDGAQFQGAALDRVTGGDALRRSLTRVVCHDVGA